MASPRRRPLSFDCLVSSDIWELAWMLSRHVVRWQNSRPFLPSRFCIHLLPPVSISCLPHIASGSWVLYRRCKKRKLCICGRDCSQFSEATFLFLLYCAGISLRVATFLLILYCAVISLRIDLLCLDGTLANFFLRRFGSYLVLCGRFPSDRSSLPRQNSRQFFRSMFFSHSVLWGHFLREIFFA